MNRTIDQLLAETCATHPDRVFWRSGQRQVTYAEAHQRAERVARALVTLGVRPGMRVGLVSENRIEALELLFGCARLGAIFVPLNIFLRGESLRHQLKESSPAVLVVDRAGQAATKDLIAKMAERPQIVVLDSDRSLPTYSALVDAASPDLQLPHSHAPQDTAMILFTSGTTGLSKGCMVSHGYMLNMAVLMGDGEGIVPGDVILTYGAIFHLMGNLVTLTALCHRGTVVLDSGFSARQLLPRVRETGATIFKGVGAMGQALMSLPPAETDRDHTLRNVVLFPFTEQDLEQFESRFGVRVFSEIYGQTECCPVTYTPASSPVREPGSMGWPAPHLEVRVVDEYGEDVPLGTSGELVARPRGRFGLFDGYWNNPEATQATWRDLWHHTGDLARINESGSLHFVDRKKDAIRRRGENVSSVELELVIAQLASVAEVAVHAVEGDLGEDDIKACIVVRSGAEISAQRFFDHLRGNLPYYAIPRYVELVEALPRNAMGRVMKDALRRVPSTQHTWDLFEQGLVVRAGERR